MLRGVAMSAAALAAMSACSLLGEPPLNTMPAAADAEAWARYVPWDSSKPVVRKTGSGMEYIVLAAGPADGQPPTKDQDVKVRYEGRLNADGKKIDSSFDRNETATLPVGGVIPGFSEALKLMRPGDAWLVYMPSKLGYGAVERYPIPANADLVFEIEMVAVH